jgi:PAS domain S-box-containing protein
MGVQRQADDLQEIVALCDADGMLLEWNKAGEEITGFPREDVIGYHIDSIIAPDARATLGEIFAIQRSGTILPGLPIRLLTNFGMEVPTEVTSIPRSIPGQSPGWLLIFRDTTLKVQLQEQLDKLDILYHGLVEDSPDIIYVLDARARVLFINDTVEKLLGYTKRELLGNDLIDIVHPEDRQHAYWPLRERRQADRATRNLQLRLLTKAGAQRRYELEFVYISLSAMGLVPVRQRSGSAQAESLGTQGVARDMTELMHLRDFSRQVGLILPICSVCHKIRASEGPAAEWLPLTEYLGRRTGILFSHTFCPDHMP